MSPTKSQLLSREAAETIAVQALAFIAGDSTRLGQFLAESGLGPETIRKAASDPSFLSAVLDYVMSHEEDMLAVAAQLDIDAKYIGIAHEILSGPKSTLE